MTPRERGRLALERSLRGREDATVSGVLYPDPAEVGRIRSALRRLSPIKREVLLAVRLEDCSFAEIARKMGLSVAEVEQLFATALSEYLRNLDQPWRRWWRRL